MFSISSRLLVQDFSKETEKMKTADPKKYEHVDRLGMGFQQASKKYSTMIGLLYLKYSNGKIDIQRRQSFCCSGHHVDKSGGRPIYDDGNKQQFLDIQQWSCHENARL